MVAASCQRPSLSGPACAWTPHRFYLWGGFLPFMGAARETPVFDIKLSLGTPIMSYPRGYLLKSFPQRDTSVRWCGFGIRVFPLLGELTKAIESQLLVCKLYQLYHQVVFAYDQVNRPHRSYCPSGGLIWVSPRTCHRWICLQLSGA